MLYLFERLSRVLHPFHQLLLWQTIKCLCHHGNTLEVLGDNCSTLIDVRYVYCLY